MKLLQTTLLLSALMLANAGIATQECKLNQGDGNFGSERCFSLWANDGYLGDRDAGNVCASVVDGEIKVFTEATGYFSLKNIEVYISETSKGEPLVTADYSVKESWDAGAQVHIATHAVDMTTHCDAPEWSAYFSVHALVGELCEPFHAAKPWIDFTDLEAYATKWTNFTDGAIEEEEFSVTCTCTFESEAPEATEAPEVIDVAETLAPDTVAPDTVAPDTVAPDTVAPDTVAPETVAPETEAPGDPNRAPPPPGTMCVDSGSEVATATYDECFDMNDFEKTIGTICARMLGDQLEVTVSAGEQFTLFGNHFWVGDSLGDLPMKDYTTAVGEASTKPDVQRFPKYSCEFEGENEATFQVTMADQCQDGVTDYTLFLVAHSVSLKSLTYGTAGERTSAFGVEHDGGNADAPWSYIDIQINCECPAPTTDEEALIASNRHRRLDGTRFLRSSRRLCKIDY